MIGRGKGYLEFGGGGMCCEFDMYRRGWLGGVVIVGLGVGRWWGLDLGWGGWGGGGGREVRSGGGEWMGERDGVVLE